MNTLNTTITALLGTPVPACVYNFGVMNVSQFVGTAQIFENVGVMAYNGAVDTISSEILLTVAATIATVEARHASYLNLLVGLTPFPNTFDNATDPVDIVSIVSPFITSCPSPLNAAALPLRVSALPTMTPLPGASTRPQGPITAALGT